MNTIGNTKRTAAIALIVLLATAGAWAATAAAAPAAGRENAAGDTGAAFAAAKDAKWFKVLVVDVKTRKDKVKITLPISVVEAFVRNADSTRVRMRRHHCDIDFREVLAELKKAGPSTVIEIEEDDAIVKVWLE
jgi:hypothetical protein